MVETWRFFIIMPSRPSYSTNEVVILRLSCWLVDCSTFLKFYESVCVTLWLQFSPLGGLFGDRSGYSGAFVVFNG